LGTLILHSQEKLLPVFPEIRATLLPELLQPTTGRNIVTEPNLRYADLIGQKEVVGRLKAFTDLFVSSGTTPGHILLIGEPGMGQATIAATVANELAMGFFKVSAASFEVQGDFTAFMTNVRKRQVILLSEIQLFRRAIWSRLKEAMRDGKLPVSIGQGPTAKSHVMELGPFTLIATCPKKLDCPSELLSEFSLVLNLQPYSKRDLQALAVNIANASGITLEGGAADLLAQACDGRPAHLASILQRLAKAMNKNVISKEDLERAFAAYGIPVRSDVSHNGNGSITNLSGIEFESLISSLLTRMGFTTEMTRTTGDGGIDIIAVLDKPIVGGRYLFQCKRFAPENLVGAPMVRDFYGAVTADRAVKGIFVTTSDFTVQAREFAERAGVELIDLRRLENLFLEYGVAALQG
jgi:Holliday junction resolvasome RuvABC ATP-dependent DNA helicase subunit